MLYKIRCDRFYVVNPENNDRLLMCKVAFWMDHPTYETHDRHYGRVLQDFPYGLNAMKGDVIMYVDSNWRLCK